jgi:hypothetical protein
VRRLVTPHATSLAAAARGQVTAQNTRLRALQCRWQKVSAAEQIGGSRIKYSGRLLR